MRGPGGAGRATPDVDGSGTTTTTLSIPRPQTQARQLLEALAEASLDAVLAELVGDAEAKRTLEAIFERHSLPALDRIAAAAEGAP